MDAIIDCTENTDGLVLVLTERKNDVEVLAAHLDCSFIHGEVRRNDRASRLEEFRSGEQRFLVANKACFYGMHVSNIRFLFFVGAPESLTAAAQAIGRAGRDGRPSEVYLLAAPQENAEPPKRVGFSGTELVPFFMSPDVCVNHVLGRFLDGKGYTCLELQARDGRKYPACSACTNGRLVGNDWRVSRIKDPVWDSPTLPAFTRKSPPNKYDPPPHAYPQPKVLSDPEAKNRLIQSQWELRFRDEGVASLVRDVPECFRGFGGLKCVHCNLMPRKDGTYVDWDTHGWFKCFLADKLMEESGRFDLSKVPSKTITGKKGRSGRTVREWKNYWKARHMPQFISNEVDENGESKMLSRRPGSTICAKCHAPQFSTHFHQPKARSNEEEEEESRFTNSECLYPDVVLQAIWFLWFYHTYRGPFCGFVGLDEERYGAKEECAEALVEWLYRDSEIRGFCNGALYGVWFMQEVLVRKAGWRALKKARKAV